MADIGIDIATGNIRVSQGRIVIVTEREAVKQRVQLALLQLLGEWFLDRTEGTDHFGQILTRPFRPNLADREVRRVVLGCRDVKSILTVTAIEIPATQSARIRVRFLDVYGNQSDVDVTSP